MQFHKCARSYARNEKTITLPASLAILAVAAGLLLTACAAPAESGSAGSSNESSGLPTASTAGATAPSVAPSPEAVNPQKGEEIVYQNPVFNETFADPSVIRGEDGWLYAFATQDGWEDGKTHLNAIIRSRDLVNWEYVGDVFEELPDWNDSAAIWATDILKVGDKYLFYYTLIDKRDENPAIGVASADSPAGPFTDHGKIIDARSFGIFAIDPFPVYDENGKLYLVCGNYEQGTYIFPLTDDGLKRNGARQKLAAGFEGAYIIRRNGYYYLFGSLGSCCEGLNSTYHVCVARSETLTGPYVGRDGQVLTEANKDEGTILLEGKKPADGSRYLLGPGNNCIVRDDNGVDWIVYHAIDSEKPTMENGGTRRPLCIDPLVWDEDGWPTVMGGAPSTEGRVLPYFE